MDHGTNGDVTGKNIRVISTKDVDTAVKTTTESAMRCSNVTKATDRNTVTKVSNQPACWGPQLITDKQNEAAIAAINSNG
jgi:hypothetical protein